MSHSSTDECKVFVYDMPKNNIGGIKYDAVLPLKCLLLKQSHPDIFDKLTQLESHLPVKSCFKRFWNIVIDFWTQELRQSLEWKQMEEVKDQIRYKYDNFTVLTWMCKTEKFVCLSVSSITKIGTNLFWTGNVPILWVYLQGKKQKSYFLLQRTPKEHLK